MALGAEIGGCEQGGELEVKWEEKRGMLAPKDESVAVAGNGLRKGLKRA